MIEAIINAIKPEQLAEHWPMIALMIIVWWRIERIESNIAIKVMFHCLSCANYKKKEGVNQDDYTRSII